MNHYPIVILTAQEISFDDCFIIKEKVNLIDDCHLSFLNETISFDYLIMIDYEQVTRIKEIGILTEHHVPITNYCYQTFIENIYFCHIDKIQNVLEQIYYPE